MSELNRKSIFTPDDLPPPDALIQYPDGSQCAVMFQYALEGHDIGDIARDNGFDIRGVDLDEDTDSDLYRRYFEDGDEDVIRDWHPPVPDGWTLAGKWDSDDGPVAWFVKAAQS